MSCAVEHPAQNQLKVYVLIGESVTRGGKDSDRDGEVPS